MDIDWVTVTAQVVNFLVLVYLLKRFLYAPVLAAMQRREERIADRMDTAEERERTAAEAEASFRESARELEQRRDDLLREARQEADGERRQLREQARSEVQSEREQWLAGLERERNRFLKDLRGLAASEIIAATRRLLTDLADASLEECVVRQFIERLHNADDEVRGTLSAGRETVVVASAFELTDDARNLVVATARDLSGNDAAMLQFEQDPDLLCGIELRAGGYKLSWSADSYLDAIEQRIARQLESPA